MILNASVSYQSCERITASSKVQRTMCIIVVIDSRSQMSSTHLSHPPSLLQLQQQMSKSRAPICAHASIPMQRNKILCERTLISVLWQLPDSRCKRAHADSLLLHTATYNRSHNVSICGPIAFISLTHLIIIFFIF